MKTIVSIKITPDEYEKLKKFFREKELNVGEDKLYQLPLSIPKFGFIGRTENTLFEGIETACGVFMITDKEDIPVSNIENLLFNFLYTNGVDKNRALFVSKRIEN